MAKIIFNRINFILIFISFFIINSQDLDNNENILVINYYCKDGKVYSIEEKEGNFKIFTKEVVNCLVEPCIFPILDENPIEDEEDCKILKSLFEEIFKDSDDKEKSVTEGDITEEQMKKILNVLDHNKIMTILEYEILESGEDKKLTKKGYIYEMEDESAIYTIGMGEKTVGYSIEIRKIKIKGNNVSIYVVEKEPINIMISDFNIYPVIKVKFNHLPSIVEVINYETGEIYPCLM
jgi:hypothetical protein